MKDMDFETQLQSIASGMDYPPTPDIAGAVTLRLRVPRPRRTNQAFARSLVIVLVLLLSLLLIPPVRAAVLDFIQVGIVRIFRSEPEPTLEQIPATRMPVTATPPPTLSSLIPLLEEMAGETTLAGAKSLAGYPILLPTYPASLDVPDRVFVQDAGKPMTILVWVDPQKPDRVSMSLHFIPEGSWAVDKFEPSGIEETNVDGTRAIWAIGPYPLRMRTGDLDIVRMVNGHVLIWEETGVTYRLETDVSLEEAVKIAESLQPIP